MAARKESSIQTAVIKFLKEIGAAVYNNHGNANTGSGRPDVFACVRGRFVAIETKREGEQPTKLQRYELNKIQNSEGIAFPAWTVQDVKQKLGEAGLL